MYNTPTTFQGIMNKIFRNFLNKYIIVFINNILIYFKIKEKYKVYIKEILRRLRKYKFITNVKKCI